MLKLTHHVTCSLPFSLAFSLSPLFSLRMTAHLNTTRGIHIAASLSRWKQVRKWEASTQSVEEEEWVFKQIFFFFLTFWEEKQGNRLFEHVDVEWTSEGKMPSEHVGELINEGDWKDGRSLRAVKTLITSISLAHLSLPFPSQLHLHGERRS